MTKTDDQELLSLSLQGPSDVLLYLRIAQMEVNSRIGAKEFKIPIHLAMGHEAVAVALHEARQPEDPFLLSHRNIHFNLAAGCSLADVLSEYSLSEHGVCGGILGSMNLSQPAIGGIFTSSILGNNLPIATGVALAERVSGTQNVVWVTTGDGAIEEGTWYESLLFCSSQQLPIVFLVEDNRWSLATEVSERRTEIDEQRFVGSLGVGFQRVVKGGDVDACVNALRSAREAASAGQPQVVHVDVTTLGFRWVPTEDDPAAQRMINYHAGVANLAGREASPMLEDSDADPIHCAFPGGVPADAEARVRAVVEREVACFTLRK